MLGNDVVDLQEARALEKEKDPRFLARVFSPEEQSCIHAAIDPALALWMIWAAKESLFKAAVRKNIDEIFAHARFRVPAAALQRILQCHGSGCLQEGDLHWEWNEHFVHAVFGACEWRGEVELVQERSGFLSEQEGASVHSPESRQVRLLAKSLLPPELELIRARRGERFLPPEAEGYHVSLSHDGRYVAAVVSASL